MSGEAIEVTGVVLDHLRGDLYEVEAALGSTRRRVLAKRSGRLVLHRIFVLPGDDVTVEVSPYDLNRGRIVHRITRNGRRFGE
jgi:translation initiation factor IF-1